MASSVVVIADARRERRLADPPRHFAVPAGAHIAALRCQDQLRLPGPDQVDIDLGQQLGVEQGAVLGAAGIVDRIARAEIVEPVRHPRMLAAGQQQRVDQPVARNGRPLDAVEFGIDEADIERRVVDHQRRIGDELQELVDHMGEQRLVGKELAGKAVHGEGFGRHGTFRIDVAVKGLSGRHAIDHLDTADFNQPVAAQRVEAGGFGIENDFAHGLVRKAANQLRRCGILATCCRMSLIWTRTGSRPSDVSTTKSARLRFSASGS